LPDQAYYALNLIRKLAVAAEIQSVCTNEKDIRSTVDEDGMYSVRVTTYKI
jgi:hypothetical protein